MLFLSSLFESAQASIDLDMLWLIAGHPNILRSMSGPTLYDLLGCSRTASSSEIRKAYLRSLPEAHPDKGGSSTAFAAVQHAYSVLGDGSARQAYDDSLTTGGQEAVTVETFTQESGRTDAVHRAPVRKSARQVDEDEQRLTSELEQALEGLESLVTGADGGAGSEATAASQRVARAYMARSHWRRAHGCVYHALFDAREAARHAGRAGGSAEAEALVRALQAQADSPSTADDEEESLSDDSTFDI